MIHPDEKIIALSKAKLLLMLFGSVAFLALGIWLLQVNEADMKASWRYLNPALAHGIGLVSIIFFGACSLFFLGKLFDGRPGLVLNASGMLDNSSSVAAGLIPWSEIIGFSIYEVQKQQMLVVKVKDPEKYINRGGGMKWSLNRMNMRLCGSPIAITSNALKIGLNDLIETCNAYLSRYGRLA